MGALVTQSEPRQEISPADAPAALRGIPAVPRPAGLARQLAAQGACVREGCAVRLEPPSSAFGGCQDLFAYVLLLHLVRALPVHCHLIEARGHLDVGFSCFSIFCVCSTIASLWMPLPSVSGDFAVLSSQEDDEQRHGQGESQTTSLRLAAEGADSQKSGMLFFLGRRGTFWLVLCLALASMALLAAGVLIPCMGLQLRVGSLVQPAGPLPAEALPFLERLDLESQVNSRVSMWDCMGSLLNFSLAGYGNSFLALAIGCVRIFAVFVIGATAMDLVLLVITTNLLVFQLPTNGKEDASNCHRTWAAAHALQHVSMLGPAVMGVMVTCLAADNFKKQGVEIFMLPGLFVLFLAELLHYAAYCITEVVVESLPGGDSETVSTHSSTWSGAGGVDSDGT
ncbi:unnamed protein product [Prorocentrum cordatum]|uniref:Solute carrier family 40 protein n=1 Tax=Prorocentrum cordatum TaxID=2364126 RepID=A0ABN9WQW6_9DINO|nr:unnamed protein product [Polarella glacialis]